MLVRLIKLIADKRRYAWLYTSRTERDEAEAGVEPHAIRDEHRQAGLPDTVDQAQPEDGVVLAK